MSTRRPDLLSQQLTIDLQCEDDTAQARAKYNLNCAPRSTRQRIQVAGESDARQDVGEEDVYSAGDDLLVEQCPI